MCFKCQGLVRYSDRPSYKLQGNVLCFLIESTQDLSLGEICKLQFDAYNVTRLVMYLFYNKTTTLNYITMRSLYSPPQYNRFFIICLLVLREHLECNQCTKDDVIIISIISVSKLKGRFEFTMFNKSLLKVFQPFRNAQQAILLYMIILCWCL